MRRPDNAEDAVRKMTFKAGGEMDRDIWADTSKAQSQSQRTTLAAGQKNVRKIIMKSPITKLAGVAIVIIAVLIGIRMLSDSAKEPSRQVIKQQAPPAPVEGEQVGETLYAELNAVRQMATIGDVKGLTRILSAGRFESKLVAANFLAKIGGLPALETLPMHASGNLILDIRSGNIRLHSTKSEDWLELAADTLHVHTDQGVREAKQVRLTYDIRGDDEEWEQLQREFPVERKKRAELEKELAELSQRSPGDVEQLRKRLAKYNDMLDGMDEAIYISVENGGLMLNCPFRRRAARVESRDGVVRVEWHGHIVEADSITLLLGLAPVRTDGPPLPITGWRSRLDEVYSLDDGEVLRWVRYPYIPERQIYATQELHYYSGTDNPPPPGYLYFRWDGKLRNWTLAMHECSLGSVLRDIGFKRYELDGPEELLRLKLGGDWIARDSVPPEDRLLALERILQNELGRTIRFEKRKVNRDAIIVYGQYKRVPLEGVKHPNKIYVYPDSAWGPISGPEPFGGGGTGSIVKLIEMIGSHFNRPVVFETEDLSDITVSYFTSQSYSLAIANAKTREDIQETLDSVLQNLSKQTSLQFEYGQREQDVWFITEQAK